MKWKKMGKTVNAEGTTITYWADTMPVTIESRKRHIPHANGVGTWDHTSYFVIWKGHDVKEFMSLTDAKEYAKELEEASNGF